MGFKKTQTWVDITVRLQSQSLQNSYFLILFLLNVALSFASLAVTFKIKFWWKWEKEKARNLKSKFLCPPLLSHTNEAINSVANYTKKKMKSFSHPLRHFSWSPPFFFSFSLSKHLLLQKWKLRSRRPTMLEKLLHLSVLLELEPSCSPSQVQYLGRAAQAGRAPTIPLASVLHRLNSAGRFARLSFAKVQTLEFVKLNKNPVLMIQNQAKRSPKFQVSLIWFIIP